MLYHSPASRNKAGKCARTACEADMGDRKYKHKHMPWYYCHKCALKINAACPEAPPFDLTYGNWPDVGPKAS